MPDIGLRRALSTMEIALSPVQQRKPTLVGQILIAINSSLFIKDLWKKKFYYMESLDFILVS